MERSALIQAALAADQASVPPPPVGPTIAGHEVHWSEVFFAVMTLLGILFFILGLAHVWIPSVLIGAIYLVASGTACILIWNLVSVKRLAAATDLVKQDVKRFEQENTRAKGLQTEKRRQDEEMKAKIARLKQGEVLLRGSALNLEGIRDTERQMMGESQALLLQRQELGKKCQQDLTALESTTLDAAQEELTQRCEMAFPEDFKKTGIPLDSPQWIALAAMLHREGISLNGANAHVGDDGKLNYGEFDDFLEKAIGEYFGKLKAVLKANSELHDRIIDMEMNIQSPRFADM